MLATSEYPTHVQAGERPTWYLRCHGWRRQSRTAPTAWKIKFWQPNDQVRGVFRLSLQSLRDEDEAVVDGDEKKSERDANICLASVHADAERDTHQGKPETKQKRMLSVLWMRNRTGEARFVTLALEFFLFRLQLLGVMFVEAGETQGYVLLQRAEFLA